MGSSPTFFAVRFDDVARGMLDVTPGLAQGWLGERVADYLEGSRDWTTVAYTLQKLCSVLGESTQLSTWERGYHMTTYLSRLDTKVGALGIAGQFYSHFDEPFPDRPVALPAQSDWPNVGFFANASLRRFVRDFDEHLPAIPEPIRRMQRRLDVEEHDIDVDAFDRVVHYTRLTPHVDWDFVSMDLMASQSSAELPLELLAYDIARALDFVADESERAADPFSQDITFDVAACDMLTEWVERTRPWADAGKDLAVFIH